MPDLQSSERRSNQALAVTNLALAGAQPLAAYVTKLTGRGVSEADRARKVDGPVSPVPGAFVIWLPLFATSLGYGARITREHVDLAPLRRVEWLMSATYACNTAWSLQAQLRGLGWPSVGLIVASAASASVALIGAARLAERAPPDAPERALLDAPEHALADAPEPQQALVREARAAADAIAPLAGWLTLATFANLEATLNETGGRPRRRAEVNRSLLLLGGLGVVASGVAIASRGHRRYTAAIAWGLGGVVLRNLRARNTQVAAVAGLGLVAALAATLTPWPPRAPSGAPSTRPPS